MRFMVAVLTGFVAAGIAMAQPDEALNAAIRDALDQACASLEQTEGLDGIVRIGVAPIEGADHDITALVRSVLTKTPFEVVLTDDADLAPLLDEFARQVRRKDIILEETAHELRVQGVDAVMFGAVERLDVGPSPEPGATGTRATARLLLNLASVREENPGTLVWSEQITGSAPLDFEQRIVWSLGRYRLVIIAAIALLAVLLVLLFVRRASMPR